MSVAERIQTVQRKIAAAAERSGRRPRDITLIAVSKTVPIEIIQEAAAAGMAHFGENRVMEGLRKMNSLSSSACWHLIGTLQTNKVKQAVPNFALIHALDRWRLAEALEERGSEVDKLVPVLIEVNVSGEASKHGISPGELHDFLQALKGLPHLQPQGLMTMAPWTAQPEETRPVFRELARCFREHTPMMGAEWKHLSMGMSNDFEVAVEEGATFVRVGTAIFDRGNLHETIETNQSNGGIGGMNK